MLVRPLAVFMQLWAVWCAHCQYACSFGLFGAPTSSMHAALGCLRHPLVVLYTCSFGLLGMRIVSIQAALGCLVRSLSVYVQLWAVRYAHYKYSCSFGLFGALTVSIRAALGC